MTTSVDQVLYLDVRDGNIVSTEEKRLTLAYEGLEEMPDHLMKEYGDIVEILDLSYNKLTNVDFLSPFKKLTTIILDHNYLTAETVFPTNRNVTTLWLNHNLVDRLHPFIQKLGKSFPNLKYLSLMGNPGAPSYLNGGTYYEYIQYRFFVISWIPSLKYLDDRLITDDQRNEANRLYGRSYYKILVHEQIPEFMDRMMGKLKGMNLRQSIPPQEEHEISEISRNPSGSGISTYLASIPVQSHPVRLNSSDSDSSLSSSRRKQRNLVI